MPPPTWSDDDEITEIATLAPFHPARRRRRFRVRREPPCLPVLHPPGDAERGGRLDRRRGGSTSVTAAPRLGPPGPLRTARWIWRWSAAMSATFRRLRLWWS